MSFRFSLLDRTCSVAETVDTESVRSHTVGGLLLYLVRRTCHISGEILEKRSKTRISRFEAGCHAYLPYSQINYKKILSEIQDIFSN